MFSTHVFKADEAQSLALIHFLGDVTECDSYISKLSEPP